MAAGLGLTTAACTQQTPATRETPAVMDGLDRSVLPIAPPTRAPLTELDVRQAKAPPRFEVTAEGRAKRRHRAG